MEAQNNNKTTKQANKSEKRTNLIRLPRFFASVFSNPKYTRAQLDLLVALASKSLKDGVLDLSSHFHYRKKHTAYIKNTLVSRLKALKIKDTDVPVFASIEYVDGAASIRFAFSDYIAQKAALMDKEGYIIVNIDDFFRLKGLYHKLMYLQFSSWQKQQKIDFYLTGKGSINNLLDLPTSYRARLFSKVIQPSIKEIHKNTLLGFYRAEKYPKKLRIVFKRFRRATIKQSELPTFVIHKYPYRTARLPVFAPLKIKELGFHGTNAAQKQAQSQQAKPHHLQGWKTKLQELTQLQPNE